ncbi:MAG TPA: hypothetical protein VNB49_05945 [Candidatus Dormibacteraeota bacterium]|nr:hypothetical protein [Candidatus Dormibacteraeota bacterium]
MSGKHNIIPVWFFVGVLLLIYGLLISVSGVAEWSHPPEGVELANLHAPVWWGALLVVLGLIYCIKYYPDHQA